MRISCLWTIFVVFVDLCFPVTAGRREVYLADRDHCIFQAPEVEFRQKHDLMIHLSDTLVDGVRPHSPCHSPQALFIFLFFLFSEKMN